MSKVRVAIHDWGRKTDLPMEDIGDAVASSDRLRVFKMKESATEIDFHDVWEKNM